MESLRDSENLPWFVFDDNGLIVFDYSALEAVGVRPEAPEIVFDEFAKMMDKTERQG